MFGWADQDSDENPSKFLVETARIIMGTAHFDESMAKELAEKAAERCPMNKILLRRHLCAIISDLPRVLALQVMRSILLRLWLC
jgi:hypothetical protein